MREKVDTPHRKRSSSADRQTESRVHSEVASVVCDSAPGRRLQRCMAHSKNFPLELSNQSKVRRLHKWKLSSMYTKREQKEYKLRSDIVTRSHYAFDRIKSSLESLEYL